METVYIFNAELKIFAKVKILENVKENEWQNRVKAGVIESYWKTDLYPADSIRRINLDDIINLDWPGQLKQIIRDIF